MTKELIMKKGEGKEREENDGRGCKGLLFP